ncbi:MAG: amidohydrolase family protein [Fulvivirga sp.]|uniref:amidohydrolase family protein n=1 Tax=Fulvivirga sp. TaxID=1931237 RepID=UPI0032EFEA79
MKKILKVITIVVGLIMLASSCSLLYIKREVRQLSGENTTVVDPTQFEIKQGKLALTNVNVLSPNSDSLILNQTVLIDEKTIVAIGENLDIPKGYQVINHEGKYLIPGLVDTHIHAYKSKNDLLLYIANGITQVAFMSSWKGTYLDWKKEAQEGIGLSPHIYIAAGPMSTAHDLRSKIRAWFAPIPVYNSPKKARKAVRKFKEEGYDAVKAYTLENEIYHAVSEESKKQGIEMVGHLTPYADFDDLYSSNQTQIAHVEEITKAVERQFGGRSKIYWDSTEYYLDYLKKNADEIARKIKEKDIVVSTTVIVYECAREQDLNLTEYLKTIDLEYMNPGIIEGSKFNPGWLPGTNNRYDFYPQDSVGISKSNIYWNTYIKAVEIMTRALARNGVALVAGTDAGNSGVVPGFSLHYELEYLNRIGLSNSDVLRSATSAPTKWLGTNSGTVEVGKVADLLILDKNPLEDIRNTRQIEAVITNGRLIEKSQLNLILSKIKEANNESRKTDIQQYLD